jgi:UDP-glucose:(heptosyl)LPS alpha-1,3-glucosyltransferase
MERLALIRQKYNPAGGAERFVSQALLSLQQDQSIALTLIARQWQPLPGVDFVKIDPFYMGSLWRDWSFSRAVQRHLKETHYTLTQTHERIPGCTLFRAGDGVHRVWLQERKRLLPWWRQKLLTLNPYHQFICSQEVKLFTSPSLRTVICNSHLVKNEITHLFPTTQEKLTVIYNGVDFAQFNPSIQQLKSQVRHTLGIPPKAPTLVFVGSGFERKGLKVVLAALAAFPEIHLIVVGQDKHFQNYKNEATNRIHFVSTQKDVRPYLGAADGFILPTLYDPFPNAGIEALACGLPVFTSTKCGTAELIQEGITGYVRDSLDITGFQQALKDWLAKKASWPKLSQQAHQSVTHLSLEQMTQQLKELYHGLSLK